MHSRQGPLPLLFAAMLSIFCVGCTPGDAAGLKIDFSQLNWQTGVIAALLLWVDKSSLWAPIAKMGQPIVNFLQKCGVLKKPTTPDETPNELTSAEALAIIVDLINRTQNPALKDQLLATVPTAAETGVTVDGK